MQNYRSLKVWGKAHEIVLKVYAASKNFPKEETYGIRQQLRRAAISIPANIAEGCGKNNKKEFAHYLNISLGSANETEYYFILTKDLGYLNENDFNELIRLISEIKAMLISLIIKIRNEL